ncbi:1,4-alpha-glucan branching enzyme GlgB [Pedobacter cryoconitis]|uniref:1,4-alpha-glucan branching enzyme GlgB n=1 Tax=Pedobacter cryoconitis TaxID=188932 RepID=A0A127V7R1_9SPHI|nr:1,4-alpha-glucan branching protein GlgB [Pedobacter cryoconitis]AMP97018.1 1,4-alpha-glucan branching enzyme GlgB [Pedobacter cryoconitis]
MAKANQGKPVKENIAVSADAPVWIFSLLTDFDVALFISGKHFRLYEKMGAHLLNVNNTEGTYFSVWAPNAHDVYVTGDFNKWQTTSHRLYKRLDESGIWEGFIPALGKGTVYKYFIKGFDGKDYEKGDPFATRWEHPPQTASVVWDTAYAWKDKTWLKKRPVLNALDNPMSVYEVHLGSWQRDPSEPDRILTYKEIAKTLVPYVLEMGFTHVELMPIMEYPYYPSWGYQITGYFAASSRHGTPQELMYLIEQFHKSDIAVILDWVPSHFPGDAHGLFHFDGTHLYEHADMRKGFHPDWKSYIFNYDRNEVRSFLISNAMYWLDQFHADGLRVDAVASMLYFDFSRKAGDAATNEFGGSENLGAIQFLKDLNESIYTNFKGVHTIAEESSTYPGVTHPVAEGGLGFGMKWMMGWMNDTLKYFKTDPIDRKYNHHQLTFSITYAFTEKFMLPFSHDEVVHGKSSMIYKMPGDEWRKHANLRLLYAYMFTQPGTKLLFMGNEFAQNGEWNFTNSLDWDLLRYKSHSGMQTYVKALNKLYRTEPGLYDFNFSPEGFEWISADDSDHSIYVYTRKGHKAKDTLIVILNMTPVYRQNYKIGLPFKASWKEIFNSDATEYFGSGKLNKTAFVPEASSANGRDYSISINIAPLGAMILKTV